MRLLVVVAVGLLAARDGGVAGASADPGGEGEEEEHTPPAAPVAPPKTAPTPHAPAIVKDGMVHVPGGVVTVGSSEDTARPNERPARVVTLASFWIDRTEVTVGAYRACVEGRHCTRPARTSSDCTYDRGDALLPVSCVTWDMAQVYCSAAGKRLPREVEWEAAARGRSAIRYPWGGSGTSCAIAITLVHDATQKSCGKKGPAHVGSRPGGASPFGALDMSGNLEEWVADWYGEQSAAPPRAGASHVLRGGGWQTPPSSSRTTSRNWGSVREAGANVGFRCARDDER